MRSIPGLITGTGNSLGRLVQNIGLSSKGFFFFLRQRKKERRGFCLPSRSEDSHLRGGDGGGESFEKESMIR